MVGTIAAKFITVCFSSWAGISDFNFRYHHCLLFSGMSILCITPQLLGKNGALWANVRLLSPLPLPFCIPGIFICVTVTVLATATEIQEFNMQ